MGKEPKVNSPLASFLKSNASSGPLAMYMPGHKRNTDKFPWLSEIGIGMDITEISGADDLNDPTGFFAGTERIAAEVWGSRHAFPLVNGSTGGILAAMLALTKRGDRVLIGRNCHRSVYNACEILGLRADYVLPETEPVLGFYTRVDPSAVKAALERESYALVVITSPTYEGFISDIAEIGSICRFFGARLLVDEAHGAHLGFGGFPESAVKLGADIVVQSLHKTLPSPTQTAMLHLCAEDIGVNRVRKAVTAFQSSSPSYLLSYGIDSCVRYMAEFGDRECSGLLSALKLFGGTALENDDRAKIVLPGGSYPGVEFEMKAPGYVVAYAGLGDDSGSLGELHRAVSMCERRFSGTEALCAPEAERVLYPFECGSSEPVGTDRAAGRICAEYVWCYPPGSPVLVPGERITGETVAYLKALSSGNFRLSSSEKGLPGRIYCLSDIDKTAD